VQRLLQRTIDLGGVERDQQALQLLGCRIGKRFNGCCGVCSRPAAAVQRGLHIAANPLRADLRHGPAGEAQAVAVIITLRVSG
jgi:hypothetical protein